METLLGNKRLTILRRLIAYSEKIFWLSTDLLTPITDRRLEPRIPTLLVAKAALGMFWARMGSLNALEMSGDSRFWKGWLGGPMPSADTMAAVHSKMDACLHTAGSYPRSLPLPETQ